MGVCITLEFTAREGQADALKNMLIETLPDTRAKEACVFVNAYTDQDDPNKIVLIEEWASREAHGEYLGWRAERGDFEKLGALVAGPPVTRYFDLFDE